MIKLCNAECVPSAQLGLHGTFPMQGDLQPNPDWAKLPLFDRKDWIRVRFGDVVQNVNQTERSPAEAGIERFIGLEHVEPRSLHVRAWGDVANGTTFTRLCRPGQVLFGKRRAYQRKVAVAEFDAVVSGDIYVFSPKDERLLPELLPFLCMSERFFQRAVGTSAGSLSPRTNWSSLASFEFDLPPLDRQRRIAEILWAVDEAMMQYHRASVYTEKGLTSFVSERCLDKRYPRVPLEYVLNAIMPGKSVVGINEPASSGKCGVLKVSAVGPNGFDPLEHKRLIRQDDFISRFAVKAGDFLITRCNTKELVGRACIVPEDYPSLMLCDKTIRLEFAVDKVAPAYILALLKSRELRVQIEARATGTGGAMKNISQDDIRSLIIPLPDLHMQVALLREIEKGMVRKTCFESAIKSALKFQTTLTNAVMD